MLGEESAPKNQLQQQTMSWMGVWCANEAIEFYIKEFNENKELYKNLHPKNADIMELVIIVLKLIKGQLKSDIERTDSAVLTASPKMMRLLEAIKQ